MSGGPSARLLALVGPLLAAGLTLMGLLAIQRSGESERLLAARLADDIGARLQAPAGSSEPLSRRDSFEDALTTPAGSLPVDALPFYDESERAAFSRSRWVGDPPSGLRGPVLAPPYGVDARYEAGAVTLRWEADPATRALARELPRDQRLAVHIYRSDALDAAEARLLAELSWEERRYRDADLPLGGTLLAYQVWAVVVDPNGRPLAAEGGDLVSLAVPERFRLALVDGDTEGARIRVEVGPQGLAVSAATVTVGLGEALVFDGRPTGLVLQRLEEVTEERLLTRRRMAFRSDGSLVLDPVTRTPRTHQTQVLVPATRLVATLTDSTGAPRTLELDLP